MVAEGLEPGLPDEISDELLTQAETQAQITLDGRAPEDVPQIADWRAAYRAFGAKPQRTRPSVEALLRRLDTGLPRIDRITDAYNAVSIAHMVPVGGEDLDHYQGPARLVRATGDENFDTMAQGEPTVEHPKPGEVIWRDNTGVTCRQWNWRQCTRTRITPATTNAIFIIDALAALGPNGLAAAGKHTHADPPLGRRHQRHPVARLASRARLRAARRQRPAQRRPARHPHPLRPRRCHRGRREYCRERSALQGLCGAVVCFKAVLAQNGPHPLQLGGHAAQFSGQGRAVVPGGRHPLLLLAGTRSQQSLLLVTQPGSGLKVLGVDRGF